MKFFAGHEAPLNLHSRRDQLGAPTSYQEGVKGMGLEEESNMSEIKIFP
jgi:hypothetical protein